PSFGQSEITVIKVSSRLDWKVLLKDCSAVTSAVLRGSGAVEGMFWGSAFLMACIRQASGCFGVTDRGGRVDTGAGGGRGGRGGSSGGATVDGIVSGAGGGVA